MQTRGAGDQTTDLLIRKQPAPQPQPLYNTDPVQLTHLKPIFTLWDSSCFLFETAVIAYKYPHHLQKVTNTNEDCLWLTFSLRLQTSAFCYLRNIVHVSGNYQREWKTSELSVISSAGLFYAVTVDFFIGRATTR